MPDSKPARPMKAAGPVGKSLIGAAGLIVPLAVIALIVSFGLNIAASRVLVVFLINLIAVIAIGSFSGNTGIISFGHLAFVGIAAYVSGILTLPANMKAYALPDLPAFLSGAPLSFFSSLLIALLIVALIAFAVGLVIARMSGASATIGTLGLLIIVHSVLVGAKDFTRGSASFFGVPRSTNVTWAFAAAAVAILTARLYRDSAPGLQLRASREDEIGAQSVGVWVSSRRLMAWVLSAVLAGLSGVLLAHSLGAFSPKQFYLADTLPLLAMMIVGGMTTTTGAVVGTATVTVAVEALRRLQTAIAGDGASTMVVLGLTQLGVALITLFVLYRWPSGLTGGFEWDERWRARRHKRPASVSPTPLEAWKRPGGGALVVRNVSKSFSGIKALIDVSLDLRPGEIVGLIGPNGSGKTTLLNCLSGVLVPTSGNIHVDGTEVTGLPAHRIALEGVARSFQNIRLFNSLSVKENVVVAALARWPADTHRIALVFADSALTEMGMTTLSDRPANTLPYGERRRLEIARALALKPKYLFLDEPAAGMNDTESEALMHDLASLRTHGLGLLIIDHDLPLMMKLCDRLVVLNKGEIIAEGTPLEVQSDAAVIEAYLGKKHTLIVAG
jgi:branched-chain amino acid transport system permease protein